MFEIIEAAIDAIGAAFRKFWDTRSAALFFTGVSKITWVIGLSITVVFAFGFTGYILFLYLISAVCFVGCPCLGIGMAAGITALWGSLAFYAFGALSLTWVAATIFSLIGLLSLIFNQTEKKSILLYSGVHIILIALLTHFGVVKKLSDSDEIRNILHLPRIEKDIYENTNTKAPLPESEIAAKNNSNIRNENQFAVQGIDKLLDLEDPEKTKQFRELIKDEINFIKFSKENTYFIQFGAFNSLTACFDYKNDFLRDLETLYVRSDSPKFLRVPILTKEKKLAVAILFGPFDSIEDAKGEISGDGSPPPKHWVRSTQSVKDVLIDLP